MKKKHVIILGGGVSGLAARYFLTKKNPDIAVTLLEKKTRLGGLIQAETNGFFFEKGPRTFKASRSPSLLALVDELGLNADRLFSDRHAERRFLWKDGKLQKLPSNPLSLLTSPIGRKLVPALFREWKRPYPWDGDESIYSFVERRLGSYVAETFFDPLTLGIYAGDIRKLSIRSCFPFLKELETEYGSLTRGFFRRKKKKKMKGLFTLDGGVQTLAEALATQGKGEITTDACVTAVEMTQDRVEVTGPQGKVQGTHLMCALSAPEARKLLSPLHEAFQEFFQKLEMVGLTAVNVGFKERLLPHQGFGYLVPSSQNQNVLGVIFDSCVFPQQNQSPDETRLTVMLGGAFHSEWAEASDAACQFEALAALKNHLKVDQEPDFVSVTRYPDVLPQLTVGHGERVKKLETHIEKEFPHLTIAGNYLDGVSIESCVRHASILMSKI